MLTIEQIVTDENRNNRGLRDGVYDVSYIEVIHFSYDSGIEDFHPESFFERAKQETKDKIVEFCNKYPNWHVAEPYQTGSVYFLSENPNKFKGVMIGQVGHGASLLIENCPVKLLILAEDD